MTRPQLTICPTVADMLAAGSFNLDDLAEHVKTCPICKPIVQALLPVAQEAVTPWPYRIWRVELSADGEVLAVAEQDESLFDPNPAPIHGQDRLIVYTVAPTLTEAIEAARQQARTYPAR